MCLAGSVVASWSLTQEVAGSNPFTVMTKIFILNSPNSVKKFRKTPMEQLNASYINSTGSRGRQRQAYYSTQ